MRNKQIVICCLLVFTCSLLPALDFGLVLDQNADYGGYGSDGSFTYSGNAIPHVFTFLGDMSDLYISAGFQAVFQDDEWAFVPELLRTELSVYPGNMEFKIGRVNYTDPLGFIADGLFDGAKILFDSEMGTVSAGAWYTGFLYKRRANILMTPADVDLYLCDLDYGDFTGTYFAPRRVAAALGWEHLSLGAASLSFPLQAWFTLLGQFDLSDEKEKLHSQYAIAKLTFPLDRYTVDVGGCFELLQDDGDTKTAFAAEFGASVLPPLSFPSRLSLLGRYTSGGIGDDSLVAFQPLTVKTQGEIYKAILSGVSMASLDYIIQLHRSFSMGITSSYFIRSDEKTFQGYPVKDATSKGKFLGNEFFGRLLWNPLSDFQMNLGAGVFMPSLGNVETDADNSWRVELNVVFSL